MYKGFDSRERKARRLFNMEAEWIELDKILSVVWYERKALERKWIHATYKIKAKII